MRKPWHHASLLSLALLAACGSQSHEVAAVDDNATNVADAERADADTRADHLDEAAASLDAEGRQVGGAVGQALDNEAAQDLATAAAVRQGGEAQAARTEDAAVDRIDRIETGR